VVHQFECRQWVGSNQSLAGELTGTSAIRLMAWCGRERSGRFGVYDGDKPAFFSRLPTVVFNSNQTF
jgi:hypothetical protein